MHKKLIILGFAFLLLNIPNISFAQEDEKLVILHTNSGDLVIEFFPEDAPNHVDNFVKLTEDGFYDRTFFHRVIKDFMIQGGDPKTKPGGYETPTEWGTGNPGYTIDAEFNDIKHNRGIVSMARSANPNSAGSQFFIVHKDSNFLDGEYTVFGRLATQESFDTLEKIANLEIAKGGTIPIDWGQGEILSAEVVNHSEVSNLLNLGEPERISSTPESPSSEEYVNDELGFSFSAPVGWQIQEPTKTHPTVPDVVAVGPRVGEMNSVISFSITNSGGKTLNEQVSDVKNSLEEPISSGQLKITSEKTSKIKNKDSYTMEATSEFSQNNSTIQIKFKEIIIAFQDKFYTITYSSQEDNFDDYLDFFEETINSFVILAEEESSNETPTEGGGCLIATAAYGSELAPQVQQLRELRDNTILNTKTGFAFMSGFNQFYYSFSPIIADLERENPIFKESVKLTITPFLASLSLLNHAEINSEQEMLGYGLSIILLNIGMYFALPATIIYRFRK
jgi:peptidyl-prolyl cis-trans isomerase B (cyclophilin B)